MSHYFDLCAQEFRDALALCYREPKILVLYACLSITVVRVQFGVYGICATASASVKVSGFIDVIDFTL